MSFPKTEQLLTQTFAFKVSLKQLFSLSWKSWCRRTFKTPDLTLTLSKILIQQKIQKLDDSKNDF